MQGQRRVNVGCEKQRSASQILQSMGQLQVVDMKIQAAQHDAHLRVNERSVGKALEVGGCDVPAQGWISSTDEGDTLRGEFSLHASLADDKNLVLAGGQLQDARDVNRRGVGRAEDILGSAWETEARESFDILLAGFCGVVGDENSSLAFFLKGFPW